MQKKVDFLYRFSLHHAKRFDHKILYLAHAKAASVETLYVDEALMEI